MRQEALFGYISNDSFLLWGKAMGKVSTSRLQLEEHLLPVLTGSAPADPKIQSQRKDRGHATTL